MLPSSGPHVAKCLILPWGIHGALANHSLIPCEQDGPSERVGFPVECESQNLAKILMGGQDSISENDTRRILLTRGVAP